MMIRWAGSIKNSFIHFLSLWLLCKIVNLLLHFLYGPIASSLCGHWAWQCFGTTSFQLFFGNGIPVVFGQYNIHLLHLHACTCCSAVIAVCHFHCVMVKVCTVPGAVCLFMCFLVIIFVSGIGCKSVLDLCKLCVLLQYMMAQPQHVAFVRRQVRKVGGASCIFVLTASSRDYLHLLNNITSDHSCKKHRFWI